MQKTLLDFYRNGNAAPPESSSAPPRAASDPALLPLADTRKAALVCATSGLKRSLSTTSNHRSNKRMSTPPNGHHALEAPAKLTEMPNSSSNNNHHRDHNHSSSNNTDRGSISALEVSKRNGANKRRAFFGGASSSSGGSQSYRNAKFAPWMIGLWQVFEG